MVRIAIFNTVCANVVWTNPILFVPNAIDRVLVLLELKIPVVKSKPLSTSAPLVNVVVPVAINASADPNVVVPDVLLIVNAAMVLVLLVIVPVPTMVAVRPVYVPPLDNVRSPTMLNAVVPGLKAVVPKSKVLNQLAVVNVCTAVPLPVNDRLGALVADPPVVPNT